MYTADHAYFVALVGFRSEQELIRKCYMQTTFIEPQLKPVPSGL
jgi:hypothetical protein